MAMPGALVTVCGHTVYEPDLRRGTVVVDLGAHRGAFSLALSARYGCRCHAVEASPELCASLSRVEGIVAHHYAVCAANGVRRLRLTGNPEAATVLEHPGLPDQGTISVPAVDLSSFVARAGLSSIDILKIDIEGAEIEALDAAPDELLRSIAQITVEFHEFNGMVRRADIERVRRRLRALGFACFRFPLRQYTDTLFVNRRRSRARLLERLHWRALPYWHRLRRVMGAARR